MSSIFDKTVQNTERAKERAMAAHARQQERPLAFTPRKTAEEMRVMVDTFMDNLKDSMLLPFVKCAFKAAAGSTEIEGLTDRIHRAELNTVPNPHGHSITARLRVWWCVDDDPDPAAPQEGVRETNYHVVVREHTVREGQAGTAEEILEKLTDFQPEDVLKYAAFV